MLKIAALSTIVALGFTQSGFAMDAMKCDEASMTKMQTDMDAMTTATEAQKATWTKEMAAAKEAMAANKMDECVMHMGNAMKAVKGS